MDRPGFRRDSADWVSCGIGGCLYAGMVGLWGAFIRSVLRSDQALSELAPPFLNGVHRSVNREGV